MSGKPTLQVVQGDDDLACVDGVCAMPEAATDEADEAQARGERR